MKKYQVWIENDPRSNNLEYDYDIVKNDKKIDLNYSNSTDWSESVQGKICATLEDDGNGVGIVYGKKKIRLDYNEFRELKCLILLENEEHIEIRETNTIKIMK